VGCPGGGRGAPAVSVGAVGPTSTTCPTGQIGVVVPCPTTTTVARTTTTGAIVIGPVVRTTTTRPTRRTTPTTDDDPSVSSRQDELPRTGAPSVPLFLAGLALLSVGALLLLASRPRGAHRQG